ncbi:MAG: nuclear transport factor 2 family protein [Parahaliea sp.]
MTNALPEEHAMSEELEELYRELRDLQARRDIHAAVCRYMRVQDRLLPELQLSAFHEDAQVDCGLFAGSPAEYVAFAQGFLAEIESSHHLIGQVDIEVDGRQATGEIYFIAHHRLLEDGQEKDLFVAGRYQDCYEDRGDGWKISARREVVDWARTDAAADAFLADNAALIRGRREEAG